MTNIDFFPHCDETGEQCRRERNPTIHVDLPATNTRALKPIFFPLKQCASDDSFLPYT
jgi:hypothetical protein